MYAEVFQNTAVLNGGCISVECTLPLATAYNWGFQNHLIYNNLAYMFGGGIRAEGSALNVGNINIGSSQGNTLTINGAYLGGGIHFASAPLSNMNIRMNGRSQMYQRGIPQVPSYGKQIMVCFAWDGTAWYPWI